MKKSNNKILTIMINVVLGVNYTITANATDYVSITGSDVVLNNGDTVINNSTGTGTLTGIQATNSLTINGGATIVQNSGGPVIGISLYNANTNNLGDGTAITVSGSNGLITGLALGSGTTNANQLEVNASTDAGYAKAIAVTGANTILNLGSNSVLNVSGDGTSIGYGIHAENGSFTQAGNVDINVTTVSGYGVYADSKAKVDLGTGSSIHTETKDGALNASGASTLVADHLTVTTTSKAGVNVQSGSTVNLGEGSNIAVTGAGTGIYTIGSYSAKSTFTADSLNVKVGTGEGISAGTYGTINIGAGSKAEGSGYNIVSAAGAGAQVNFKGTQQNRNTIINNGNNAGAQATSNGVVNLSNTDIYAQGGAGFGLWAASGTINGENTYINSESGNYAIQSVGSTAKVYLTGDTKIDAKSNTVGSAIAVGNSGLVDITGKTEINGNMYVENNGAIATDMSTGSVFTGMSMFGDNTGSINLKMTDSIWNMTYSSQVSNLNIVGSTVNFTKQNSSGLPEYETLTTDTLTGNGTFNMRTDIVGQQGDLLVVNGTANGNYKLNIANNGSSNTTGTETLTVVNTGTNNANFTLNNKIELGAYEYGLREVTGSPNDFELYASGASTGGGGTLTTTAQAASSFLNIGYLTNYIESQTLLQRLGDLRNNKAAGVKGDGFWIKSFGGKLSAFSGSSLDGFDMSYTGTQLGIDKRLDVTGGDLFVGAMAGFTRTNPNYKEGDGNGKNYIAGLYATYLLENGLYVDTVLKYNSMRNHFSVKDTAGATVRGTGKTQGISLSAELGKRFWLSDKTDGLYIEPQAQLTYGYQNGDTVNASNGLNVGLSHYESTLGRISGIVGYQIKGQNPINLYVKTGIVREMSGGASYRFNGGEKNNHSFRSSWFDNGIGANININKKHNIYAEADYSTGGKFDNAMLNLGYRYSF